MLLLAARKWAASLLRPVPLGRSDFFSAPESFPLKILNSKIATRPTRSRIGSAPRPPQKPRLNREFSLSPHPSLGPPEPSSPAAGANKWHRGPAADRDDAMESSLLPDANLLPLSPAGAGPAAERIGADLWRAEGWPGRAPERRTSTGSAAASIRPIAHLRQLPVSALRRGPIEPEVR